jgi:hypothetical protein
VTSGSLFDLGADGRPERATLQVQHGHEHDDFELAEGRRRGWHTYNVDTRESARQELIALLTTPVI